VYLPVFLGSPPSAGASANVEWVRVMATARLPGLLFSGRRLVPLVTACVSAAVADNSGARFLAVSFMGGPARADLRCKCSVVLAGGDGMYFQVCWSPGGTEEENFAAQYRAQVVNRLDRLRLFGLTQAPRRYPLSSAR
jgi:hypothetical protein